ncbi:MAG: HypC/HybG/HupF family hydrogenase formation chaperone [Thermofilaceae archaeon]
MCWGTMAVVLEVSEDGGVATVDYGDGVARRALVGITRERLARGDIVMVHAGVVISKMSEEGLLEQLEFFRDVLGEEGRELVATYEAVLALSRSLRGGGSG